MKNIIQSSLQEIKIIGKVLLICSQLYGCMSSSPKPEDVQLALSSSQRQEEPHHEVKLDSLGPNGYIHINMNYIQEISDILLKEMTVFTKQDSLDAINSGQNFVFNYKGPFDTLEQTLYNKLNINEKKQNLEKVRNGGNKESINKLELEYTKEIMNEIFKYPSTKGFHTINDILNNELLCVDKSILCHPYLEKLAIPYSIATLPGHSAIILHNGKKDYYIDPTYNVFREIDTKEELIHHKIDKKSNLKRVTFDKKRNPDEILLSQILGNKGSNSFMKGNYHEAIQYFNKTIEKDPNNALVYLSRGSAYAKIGKHKEAENDFNICIEINPNDASMYYNRGFNYKDYGNNNEAAGDLTKAKENYKKGIEDFTMAIQKEPMNYRAYLERGTCYDKSSQFDKCVQDRDKAMQLNPNPDLKKTIESHPTYIQYKQLEVQQSLTQK